MSKRIPAIMNLFESQEFWTVAQMSNELGVSQMTIRRDFDELEARKLIRRLHGGAVAVKTQNNEPFYDDRANAFVEEKRKIALVASKMIRDNSVIAIDSGSTCFELVKLIQKRRLTVVTNSFRGIGGLLFSDNIKVVVPCGILRSHEGSISGPDAVSYLSKLHVDQFFMGVGGIDSNAGFTDYSLDDVAVKKMIISNASEVITLADSSKFNRVTFANICQATEVDKLICEIRPVGKLNDYLQRSGVEVIISDVMEEI